MATTLSIDAYKRKQNVLAAKAHQRRAGVATGASSARLKESYAAEQRRYLNACVENHSDPDARLLAALREEKFVLKLDKFGPQEVSAWAGVDKSKDQIAKIITLHGVVKDEAVWSSSLRGEVAPNPVMPELLINLSRNDLGDESAETICDALITDKWLLGLNLGRNGLTPQGIEIFIDTLAKPNRTLAVFGLVNMKDPVPSSMLETLDSILRPRNRFLQQMATESREKRVALGALLLEWGVDKDTLVEICYLEPQTEEQHVQNGTQWASKKTALVSPSNQRGLCQPQLLKNRKHAHHDNNNSDVEDDDDEEVEEAPVAHGHVKTIEYLIERLSALEADKRKMQAYVNKVENGTRNSVRELVEILNKTAVDPSQVDVVVAPPALHIDLVQQLLQSNIAVCAQNVSLTGLGAYTGEIAAEHLLDFGLTWTIAGHSERRAYYGETDEVVAKKTKRALDLGLKAIFCIGETLEERQAGQTLNVLTRQTKALAAVISEDDWERVVIAYEPVWAIGTGVVATPAQAQETHQNLRQWIERNVSAKVAATIRIIYGGSVNGKNCAELIALSDVDGFLVGGASLKPEFDTIIRSAL
ncbi:hypothetical protein PHYBOEH_001991 [Phytophthora boehmeriae]|uniref:triose-phosphate isomerase n=1 Tax=Phytophthora boehmeriae TaxID=109152 RepID=A0A8T1WRU9_9STRA|nr:hypothetical protein PHYBOEH_001991 [Phytophthora boehmeriae]